MREQGGVRLPVEEVAGWARTIPYEILAGIAARVPRVYVDGGRVAPVPVRFAKQMGAEMVIAVDISSSPEGNPTGDAMRMLLQTFTIMGRSINQLELRDADIVLRPSLADVSGADFAARLKAIRAGRQVTLASLGQLRAAIAARVH